WTDKDQNFTASIASIVSTLFETFERIEAQKKLIVAVEDAKRANRIKSDFLANMSHELRTPLNSILLLSKHLSENKKNNLSKKETEFADTVYHSGQDLLELINDILDLSKVEAGKLIMHVEDIALKSIGANMKTKFVPVAKDKKISFKLKYAKDLPESILTDSQRLEQILKNFLSNAIKFTDKGSVTLEINHPDSDVVFSNNDLDPKECIAFSVIDTGVGIEPSKQTIVFEAFQQGDGSTSRKYGGTGLGLSISRSIAKALGGEIQLFSTKGDGSKFVLYLPFVFRELKPIEFVESVENNNEQNTGNRAEIEISKLIKSNENDYVEDDISVNKQKILRTIHDKETVFKGKKVLLVDDDMRNIYTLKNILEDKGITIIVAKNGKESLERLADDADVNLVLMDIIMPEMDGFEATARIRAQKKFKDLPVIALTAKAMKGDRNKCIEAGANDYLSKPVDMDKLFSMLRVWLY
ncbi:MAG: response regulator, partial [Desulfobacteraceae bacterium]|nr:response regulator [Desulfobacteraceae bacterium]